MSDLPKLAAPAQRALASAGISTLAEVAEHSQTEIAALHGIGRTALEALQAALARKGLRFR